MTTFLAYIRKIPNVVRGHSWWSVDADDTTVHSSKESAQSCNCPDCFYSDNTNSNLSLAIVPLSAGLMPVTMGTDNFIEVFVTLTRSIPPDIPPPITFLFQA